MKKILNLSLKLILTLCLALSIVSCGIWDPGSFKDHKAREIDPNADARARKAVEEGRAFSIKKATGGFGSSGNINYEFATSNPLWRATLEVLDFIPLANVDYSGGLIITDWYNEGTASNESIKITVRFLSNEIRADGIDIIVHKKVCTKFQNCTTKKIKSSLENEVKSAILTKAVMIEKEIEDTRPNYKLKEGRMDRR